MTSSTSAQGNEILGVKEQAYTTENKLYNALMKLKFEVLK